MAALVINPAMETIPGDFIESAKKSKVYFPGAATIGDNKVNYATVSHAVAKEIFGQSLFDDMLKKAAAGDTLNQINAKIHSTIKLDYKKKQIPYYASNVVGFIEGEDKKDEYVFLTAHYDHLGNKVVLFIMAQMMMAAAR